MTHSPFQVGAISAIGEQFKAAGVSMEELAAAIAGLTNTLGGPDMGDSDWPNGGGALWPNGRCADFNSNGYHCDRNSEPGLRHCSHHFRPGSVPDPDSQKLTLKRCRYVFFNNKARCVYHAKSDSNYCTTHTGVGGGYDPRTSTTDPVLVTRTIRAILL